jgi:hypothetical protein
LLTCPLQSSVAAVASVASTTSTTFSANSATAASAAATNSADSQGSSEEGLPLAAKAGIGAGIGLLVVIGAVVGLCLCCGRRRKSRNKERRQSPPRPNRNSTGVHVKISGPLPGGGRHYASDAEKGFASAKISAPSRYEPRPHGSPKSFKSSSTTFDDDLGRHARRYENMSSGAQPKLMI